MFAIVFLAILSFSSRRPSSTYSHYYLDSNYLTSLKNDNDDNNRTQGTGKEQQLQHLQESHSSTTVDKSSLKFQNSTSLSAETSGISTKLPKWMRNYMVWHRQRLLDLQQHAVEWKKQPLLIVRCLDQDRCGGTSDRLKSLPVFVLIAAKTRRLLFLRWTRPFRLEEFLQPGPALNWSIPTELQRLLDENNNNNTKSDEYYFEGKHVQKLIQMASNADIWIVEGNLQQSGGKLYTNLVVPYQESKGLVVDDWEYTTYYHDFFPSLFVPAPAIAKSWQDFQQAQNLIPNQFMVAHYRAKYPNEPYLESNKNTTILKETMVHAVHCAVAAGRGTYRDSEHASLQASSSLSPTVVYVASDTVLALELVQKHFANTTGNNNIRVVSHLDMTFSKNDDKAVAEDPPHLNFAQKANPDAFFSIFVDLWAMSQSRCVSFGAGGFGRFGSLVSHNMSCRVAHSIKGQLQTCS